ncbi:MAG: TonB-dependent receptor [Chromatiales bacterium]|nr:TonB-dependent receptor [Chromatiales bacterium]
MRSMFKRSLIAASVMGAIAAAGTAHATNGYQLIGVGAYQKSLAGAVTAAPGSAMTAITNPAGLARIEDRADFSMEAFMPKRSTDFAGGDKVDSDVELYGVPALGWKGPVGESGKMWFGGGMYGTSGLGVDYEQTSMGGGMLWDGYSAIQFWQMAPALAWNVNDKLDLGVSLNIDYQSVSFKQRVVDGGGNVAQNFDLSKGASAFGFGVTLGALYDVSENLTLGVSYKSKQSFSDLEYNLAAGDIAGPFDPNNPMTVVNLPAGKYTLDLDYPQQLSAGLAYDVSDKVTVSADVKWIDWSDTMSKLAVEGPGGVEVPMDPEWEDQIVYAIGVQWAVNEKVNLRAGFNYAEAPIQDDYVQRNFILPAVVEQHYTFGGDIKLDKHWDLGFHVMYVPEETMKVTSTNDPMFPGGTPVGTEISMDQSSVGVNLGYRF